MQRIIEYPVTAADSGRKISEFLRQRGYSAQTLIRLKKDPRGILKNGVSSFQNVRLEEGDSLTVCICEETSSEHIPPVDLPLDILYEDEDLCVINKPAGMPIHPSLHNYENSLANGLAYYYAVQGKPFVFRCINRLDRDTSGLTVIAKHYVSAGILSEMVSTPPKRLHREYLAIARGTLPHREGTIHAPIARTGSSIIERCVDFDAGDDAITHYRVLAEKNGYSLLSLQLETGRTHQIRVHMKYLGFPLIGDYLYNPDMERMTRQALHSYRLSFPHPITGAVLTFAAPQPPDMAALFPEYGV